MMYNEYFLMKLDQDRRDACLQRGAKERMFRSINGGKPDFKCRVCEKLAAFFLEMGQRLKEQAQVKSGDDLSAVGTEKLRRMLEDTSPSGFFI